MRKLSIAGFLLMFAVVCSSQEKKRDESRKKTESPTAHADCSKFDSPGCKSFNDLAQAEGLSFNDEGKRYLACFRKLDDSFFIISYYKPKESWFSGFGKLDSNTQQLVNARKLLAGLDYRHYRDGVQDNLKHCFGRWKNITEFESYESGRNAESGLKCFVDDSEISYSYSFQNVKDSTTDYHLAIRLSTLRSVETFTAAGDRDTYIGNCAAF